MDRRVTLLVAVVVLVTLSGCSVLLDSDGTSPTPTPEGTVGAQGTDGPATTAASSPGPGGTSTPAGTPTEDHQYRSFDGESVESDHVAALEAAGSFTTESSLVVRNESTTRYINGSYAVERNGPAANTANITYVVDGSAEDFPTTTRYTERGTTYERRVERTGDGTETTYRKANAPYTSSDPQPVNETVAYTLGRIARDVIDSSAWNRTGTGRIDGTPVTRYDTSGDRFAVSFAERNRGAATVVVDDDGVVRYVAYRFVAVVDGERTEYVYQAAYTDVGSTTVEEPAWTDRA